MKATFFEARRKLLTRGNVRKRSICSHRCNDTFSRHRFKYATPLAFLIKFSFVSIGHTGIPVPIKRSIIPVKSNLHLDLGGYHPKQCFPKWEIREGIVNAKKRVELEHLFPLMYSYIFHAYIAPRVLFHYIFVRCIYIINLVRAPNKFLQSTSGRLDA